MATPHPSPAPEAASAANPLGKARMTSIIVLTALLAVSLLFSWTTRDAMTHLPFLPSLNKGRPNRAKAELVDTSPWQTSQALAALAVSAEEAEFARDAERLADHAVDQAFASALRLANLDTQHRVLTGRALDISNRITQLHQLIQQDQALVDSLTAQSSAKQGAALAGGNLDVAKAQLGLDTDELSDAQRDLARISGDRSVEIQAELAQHEASMKEYDESVKSGTPPVAVVSLGQRGTLAARLSAWFNQRDRYQLLQQAIRQTQTDSAALTTQYNALEAKVEAASSPAALQGKSSADMMSSLRDRSTERQILSIFDDRIQTSQQLAGVYSKWAAQVQLQHRIVLHLILQSLALIAFIALCMVLIDGLVRHLMSRPTLDRRQMHTLRSIVEVTTQVVGAILILFVIFGAPRETTTMIGLATAGITIVMQDFILAFFGWFVLIGRNGIRVGDWVEINGVGGEVTEVGLMTTTLLETGALAAKGFPTGRRISFMNGFAIRGQYFNFSTAGQWMWDEISVTLPATGDLHAKVERIHDTVLRETEENVRQAEREWHHGSRGDRLSRVSAQPLVTMRPTSSGVDVDVRYVTRAAERNELRNRLNQDLIEMLHEQPASS
ncbi:MAG: mechanosensitive ion channel domain-containing protein [Terracidiphilus sp.]